MASLALFAQFPQHTGWSEPAIYGAVLVGIVVLAFGSTALMLFQRYRRCPSNRVMVVYGKYTGSPTGTRCIHGGARFVLPLVQDYDFLSLEPIQIEIPLKGACRWRIFASTCRASSPWRSAPTRRRWPTRPSACSA